MPPSLFLIGLASLGLTADLKDSLLFRANFNAPDSRLRSAASYKEQSAATPGLPAGGEVVYEKGALRFVKKNTKAVFFPAQGALAFDSKSWTGTISFWLSLDPETELEPGYCDPIQVTGKSFDDSAIWVDFTKDDKPRHFRLGVFGEKRQWNPQNLAADKNPDFLKRLVVVRQPPFARGKWTHVAITHEALGGGQGRAELFLNGKSMGAAMGIAEAFAWVPGTGAIRLGVNYVGLLDDLSVYQRVLTPKEISSLRRE